MKLQTVVSILLLACTFGALAQSSNRTSASAIGAGSGPPASKTVASFANAPASATQPISVTVLPSDTGPWWSSPGAALLVGVLAASMVLFQVNRQHRNELRVQEEHLKNQLRLDVYREFSDVLARAADAQSEVESYVRIAPTTMRLYAQTIQRGVPWNPPKERALEFNHFADTAHVAAVDILFMVEKYAIVHPDLELAKSAISSALHDATRTRNELFTYMIRFLPTEIDTPQGKQTVNVRALSNEELIPYDNLARAFIDASGVLSCYIGDLRTELQLVLLGPLFRNQIERRKPLDPRLKVFSLNPAEIPKLRDYLMQQTDWGRTAAETRASVEEEITRRARSSVS